MSNDLLWLIPGLPLLGAVLILLFGKWLKGQAHWPCVLGAAGACVVAIIMFTQVNAAHEPLHSSRLTWFQAGDVDVSMTLHADGLTAIMLVMVTFIGSLVAIYSVGYMHHDPGYPRFFAAVSLFLFSMTGLVLADNFVLLYAFWEGVGLCSYLLIGFWFTKPAAASAARKAFLVTRIGDVGMFLGILVIFSEFQYLGKPLYALDFDTVFVQAATQRQGVLTAACLLLFCGAIGKSAQFPLHVWLPDAMEGPSPVSALIHAATMVTAGVYLVARCMPLFGRSDIALLVVACIGAFTALLAALMALTQTDLKRVLAYSTVSQLGYMFLGLGSGLKTTDHALAAFAVTAAIFHLFTHAFFKALLFLGAGSVMHAMGNVIDMRRFSGLRKVLPTTHWTFLCGSAALAGVPLLSGFWSKDDVLHVTLLASGAQAPTSWVYMVLFISALITAALTAFYTFRAYFLTFWGPERIPEEAGHHAHESPPVMTVPLMILAVGAVLVGIVVEPFTHWFGHVLEHQWVEHAFGTLFRKDQEHAMNFPLMLGSSVFALGGIAVAWWMYVKKPGTATQVAQATPGAYHLSLNRFYLDELYAIFIVKPLLGVAVFCRVFDQYVIDGLVDLFAQVPSFVGLLFRPIQNGLVQFYALLMVLGLAGFLLSVLFR
jgi:NADH-quinone oxidoreductase subunit L